MTLSNLDQVRLMVGDTDSDDPQLTDDEVNNFISDRTILDSVGGTVSVNLPAAAADCADAIAAAYARQFNFAEDGQRFDRAQRFSQYTVLAQRLRNRSGGVAVPLGGTTSTT